MKTRSIIQVLAGSAMAMTLIVSAPLALNTYNADKYDDNRDERYYKQMSAPMVNSMDRPSLAPQLPQPSPDRVTKPTEMDDSISSQARSYLEPYNRVSVSTEQGIVRLRGNVDSVQERIDAIDRVRSISGVRNVESEITVDGDYSGARQW